MQNADPSHPSRKSNHQAFVNSDAKHETTLQKKGSEGEGTKQAKGGCNHRGSSASVDWWGNSGSGWSTGAVATWGGTVAASGGAVAASGGVVAWVVELEAGTANAGLVGVVDDNGAVSEEAAWALDKRHVWVIVRGGEWVLLAGHCAVLAGEIANLASLWGRCVA